MSKKEEHERELAAALADTLMLATGNPPVFTLANKAIQYAESVQKERAAKK